MKKSSIFSTSFQILYCALGRSIRIRNLTKLGRKGLKGSQLLKATEIMMPSTESRRNSSGTSSQDLIRCSSATKSKSLLSRLVETPEKITGIILFMSMFNDISCGTRDNEQECLAQKADVQFSVLRLHCPEVNSKAKDVVNCRFTLQPFRKQLRLFFA